MSTGLYSHTTRGIGTVLTAAIYNADHNNHITNANPSQHGAYSDDINQMRAQVDPGTVGNEILATSLAEELAQLRYVMKRLCGTTYWYEEPAISFTTINADLAVIEGDIQALETDVGILETAVAFREQKGYDDYNTYTAVTAVIPIDDTVPLSTEGVEILSAAVTLTAASSKVRVKVSNVVFHGTSGALGGVVTVFRGSTCIGTLVQSIPANFVGNFSGEFQDEPGNIGPHTYSVRVGVTAAATAHLFGNGSNRLYGGSQKATLFVEEHLA